MENRIYQYRVWDKLQNKMDYNVVPLLGDILSDKGNDNYILMQFTETEDKKGRQIYEGDICSFLDWKPKPIVWRDGRYWLGNTLVIVCKMECDQMEIIGNIFEDPKLIS